MSTDLTWVCCPKCGETVQLERKGKLGVISLQTHNYQGFDIGRKYTVSQPRAVKCFSCNHVFYTDEPIIFEAMGRDGCEDAEI